MFEIGQEVTWWRPSDDRRRRDEIRVKVVKIACNGTIVEVPAEGGGTQKVRVARDRLRPVKPPPYPAPNPRPFSPVSQVNARMLGQPVGWIPTELPKPWDPMIKVRDAEQVVHAMPAGNVALCGEESGTGWQWARGWDVSCPHCWRKIAEEEFERNGMVQHLRKLGHEGRITREDYLCRPQLDGH
jgi:hypothetical protein